jgi:integrase
MTDRRIPTGGVRAGSPATSQPPKLLDRLRAACRLRHLSPRTEEAYVAWSRRFILFHGKRHPGDMAEPEVAAFLSSLASDRHVSASTQNQALHAILFLYRAVLGRELQPVQGVTRAPQRLSLPVVLTRDEVRRVLSGLEGVPRIVAGLLYGAGLRLLECLDLRVKDVDLARREITVRHGKGGKDRLTVLPSTLVEPLQEHLQRVRRIHDEDLARGAGRVVLPNALRAK